MSTKTKVSETKARVARTAIQGTPAWAVTEFVDAFLWNMNDRQYGAAVLLLTMVIAFIQSAVEEGIGKAILRDLPSRDVPIVEEGPAA